jgi:hypothetical protein
MDQKLVQIIENTSDIFMRYGIKSVTMDDVARELKISKKTLYKYVDDKLDLVCKVMHMQCSMDQKFMSGFTAESSNAIDESLMMTEYVGGKLKSIHPSIHYDLEKYYPEAWGMFYDHKHEYIYNSMVANLERGIAEGLYRDNLNVEIIAKLYVSKIDIIFDPSVFPVSQFNFNDVHIEMVGYHIRGIASPDGIEYLVERLKAMKIKI